MLVPSVVRVTGSGVRGNGVGYPGSGYGTATSWGGGYPWYGVRVGGVPTVTVVSWLSHCNGGVLAVHCSGGFGSLPSPL